MKKSKNNRGFSLIEAIVTMIIIATGFLVLLNVFQLSSLHATQTRNRLVAELIADEMLEEINAHKFGTPAPQSWEEPTVVSVIIQGRKLKTTYTKKIEYTNNSFTGKSIGDYDFITITITWKEGTGVGGQMRVKQYEESTWVRRSYN